MYERRRQRLASKREFLRRLSLHAATSAALVLGSLALGMAGYTYFEGLAWRDAFLNASMLLGGMGPVTLPLTPGGKLFAGTYALYAGLLFLVAASVLLAPLLHRLLHRFHWEEVQADQAARNPG